MHVRKEPKLKWKPDYDCLILSENENQSYTPVSRTTQLFVKEGDIAHSMSHHPFLRRIEELTLKHAQHYDCKNRCTITKLSRYRSF